MSRQVVVLSAGKGEFDIFEKVVPEGIEIPWVNLDQPLEQIAAECREAVSIILPDGEFPVDLAYVCPDLKLIQSTGAGTDNIDAAVLNKLGIQVANNGSVNADAVAEHTIMLMVAVYRKLKHQLEAVKSGKSPGEVEARWLYHTHQLVGKTVGIIGLGAIGRAVALRLQGWQCDLVYVRSREAPSELEQEIEINQVSIRDLLQESDIVVLAVPLTKRTKGMLGASEFSLMKPSAVLINVGRGPVVNQGALITALKEGEISGAGLDVLEQEPLPPDNPLLHMDNVLITPHVADLAYEAFHARWETALGNAIKVSKGGKADFVLAVAQGD